LVFVALIVGVLLLLAGAEFIVRGGGQLALALGVPAMVVGLTVVAFGTSAPELLVSMTAALDGRTDTALGNVNGSNIANVLLVLGMAAVVCRLFVVCSLLCWEFPAAMGIQLLVPLLLWDGDLDRPDGVVLISAGVVYNTWLLYEAYRGRTVPLDDELGDGGKSVRHYVSLLLGGLVLLGVGAHLFVTGATELAQWMGWSDRFIGLTVIALGTSAPEVATAVVSAYRGESDLAVGNSLGSNILNIAMVLGLTACVCPITIQNDGVWMDLCLASAATFILIPVTMRGTMGRGLGLTMCLGYVLFMFGMAGT
jgi:cation:H+ antiporter